MASSRPHGEGTEAAGPGRCRARVVDRHENFARVCRRERLRSTFWYIPTLFILLSIVLAVVMHQVDVARAVKPDEAPWWMASSSSASAVLSTIAAAMLTFVGVVFSITLVALQLASSQLSPRVLRSFVRSPVSKLAFGTFMATFFFALFMLSQVSTDDIEVPVVGATTAMVLVLASVGMFVVYIDSTIRQMQVSQVVSRVAGETRRVVEANFFSDREFVDAGEPNLGDDPMTVSLGRRDTTVRALRRRGVLLGIDVVGIVDWAERHDAVVRQVARVGDYSPGGTALFEVHGAPDAPVDELAAMVDVGRERTLYQDPLYGLRQLVDTAVQALSAAINAPTTAVQVIDRVVDIVIRIGQMPIRSPYVAVESGAVRLVQPMVEWEQVVSLALVEIRLYGVAATQVTRRLMAAYDAIEAAVSPERVAAIDSQRAALIREVSRRVLDPDDRRFALQPDESGIA